jgi:hypothetical protein
VLAAADPGIAPRADVESFLSHQVYGYLPYWRLNAGTAGQLDYDLLSTIAFFGLGIKADGNIDMAWRGSVAYMSDNAVAVTNAAHAKGVRVVPTFQLFDSGSLPKMTAFLDSRTAQDRFIAQALDLMARRSADGANFDFEPMPASMTARYLSFLARFNTAMDARFPGATLVNASSAGAPSDLQLPLVRLNGHRGDRSARPCQPEREDPHGPLHGLRPQGEADSRGAVLRLRLAGDEHGPERDG